MMRVPLLLRIDRFGLDAWQMHELTLVRVATFACGEHAAFADWLCARPQRARCRVLVDLADEAFELEDLPRVRGADRRALIARRLGSWFARPEFALATPLAACATDAGGRFERFLFSGLNHPAPLEPWLQAVASAGHRIDRVVPAAHLLAHVVAVRGSRRRTAPAAATHEAAKSRSTLVLGCARSGLRISLLAGQSLVFSRLIEGAGLQSDAEAIWCRNWQEELMRTRDYLRTQHRIAADDTPAVLLLSNAAAGRSDDGHAAETGSAGEAAPTPIDPTRLGALGMRDETGAAIAGDELTALLLPALCRAPAHLGWPAGRHTDGLARVRRRPLLLSGVVLVAALMLGGWHWQHTAAQAAHAAAADARSARLRALQAMGEDDVGTPPDTAPHRAEDAPAVAAVTTDEDPRHSPSSSPSPPSPPDSFAQDALPIPRRIDGILRRPDGRVFLWVDGRLTDPASAGLRPVPGRALSLSPHEASRTRLRVGDHWPVPAEPDAGQAPQ